MNPNPFDNFVSSGNVNFGDRLENIFFFLNSSFIKNNGGIIYALKKSDGKVRQPSLWALDVEKTSN